MLILALVAASVPLAGTTTPLSGNPAIVARISGLLPSTNNNRQFGVRFAIHNGSSAAMSLDICHDALRVQHFRLDRSNAQETTTDVSFGLRSENQSFRSAGCEAVLLRPHDSQDIDLFFLDFGDDGNANGNRVTLTTSAGAFTFVSNPVLASLR